MEPIGILMVTPSKEIRLIPIKPKENLRITFIGIVAVMAMLVGAYEYVA